MGASTPRLVAGAVILSAGLLYGHESPEHEIKALTAQMRASGQTAELLWRRATEWRALGKWKEASADLQQGVSISPGAVSLLCELAQVEAGGGRYGRALTAVDQALALTGPEADRAGLYMVRAEILERKGDYDSALADCIRAFAGSMPRVDWYLTRGRLQSRAGKWSDCAAGLQEGFEATGSIVLEIEWIEALIDAGQFDEALKRIEPYAEGGRWKSTWLIRRARAQIGRGDTSQAHANLEQARAELTARLTSGKFDISLLIDRAFIHALLGNSAAAKEELRRIQQSKADLPMFSTAVYRLERALTQREPAR
jgi:tetratricopeptide (TPR) repeat protein